MINVAVIVGTVREGRQTLKAAKWVARSLQGHTNAEVKLLDLINYPLPFFDEPISPRFNPNRKPAGIVKDWLDALAAADAYIVVTPEYNHSIPGVLKNALDYVDFQMVQKPSAIVSHGTVGGARAAMHLKEVLSELKTLPIPETVALMGIQEGLGEDGELADELKANPRSPQAQLTGQLDNLLWYAEALQAKRHASN